MFTEEQCQRYSRNILLKEIGGGGQMRLLNRSVLIIGVGGLGSPVALYLAAAGVGTIGLADADNVDITNLQRQIIHATPDIGRPKVDSATEKLRALNPDVTVKVFQEWVTAANVMPLIAGYDFVIDCTDNFSSKFLINDACVIGNKPFSHGGILRFDGQTLTVRPRESACVRCIFQNPPQTDSCSEAGVIGVLPGVIGTVQATEALKFLLGKGDLLTGRLLAYNALRMRFREVTVERDSRCPVCGDAPTITVPRDAD